VELGAVKSSGIEVVILGNPGYSQQVVEKLEVLSALRYVEKGLG
jgi:hypothetical protein